MSGTCGLVNSMLTLTHQDTLIDNVKADKGIVSKLRAS